MWGGEGGEGLRRERGRGGCGESMVGECELYLRGGGLFPPRLRNHWPSNKTCVVCYISSSTMQTIRVESSAGSYGIECGRGELARLNHAIDALGESTGAFILSSPRAWHFCGQAIAARVRRKDVRAVVLFDDAESAKRMATVEGIARNLIRTGADRRAAIVAVGGGVVGDVAGFAAATYLRGVRLIHVATTVVAQVDSAIGGKTGVDLPEGKNLVGAFYPPQTVIADSELLRTLPHREYRSGLYEVVKYGEDYDPKLFEFLERRMQRILRRDPAALDWIISRCIAIKARVVSADERESGLRQILNFGHTMGHALEAATGYRRFLHGEAIGWGMIYATCLSLAAGRLSEPEAARIIRLVASVGPLPKLGKVRMAALRKIMAGDKKSRGGRVLWVLPRAASARRNGAARSCGRWRRRRLRTCLRSLRWVAWPRPAGSPRRAGSESDDDFHGRTNGACDASERFAAGRSGRRARGVHACARDVHAHRSSLRFPEPPSFVWARLHVWRWRTARRFREILTRPDARVLDICCGTGDLAFALARMRAAAQRSGTRGTPGAPVTGSDFVEPMLVRAERRLRRRSADAVFAAADALRLPFADASFDLVTTAFGFRNLASYEDGLREIARVLRPGGAVGILEFSEPTTGLLAVVFRFYFRRVLPKIGGAISGNSEAYAYLPNSVAKFPSSSELAALDGAERLRRREDRFVEFRQRAAGIPRGGFEEWRLSIPSSIYAAIRSRNRRRRCVARWPKRKWAMTFTPKILR